MSTDPVLISSRHNGFFTRDGVTVEICIHRLPDTSWVLEVVDAEGTSIVWDDEFETDDPAMQGEMTIIITLVEADGGTELLAVHEGLPPGVSASANEFGWSMALAKLAALVESGWPSGGVS